MTYTELNIVAETSGFHVNNVKMFGYLDQARFTWYEYCKSHGFEAVVVHVRADFKKELFDQEKLYIRTWLDRIGNTSFTLKQTVKDDQSQDVSLAEVVLTTIDCETRKKITVPNEVRELLHKDIILKTNKDEHTYQSNV